jgi:hypothetical protein
MLFPKESAEKPNLETHNRVAESGISKDDLRQILEEFKNSRNSNDSMVIKVALASMIFFCLILILINWQILVELRDLRKTA